MNRYLIPLLALIIPFAPKAETTLGFEGESAASVGIYVKDLSTGSVLAENSSQKALVPASVMKLVTAAAALNSLGSDFTFDTPVYLYGQQSSTDPAVWNGNLVIESCADPTIDSNLFEERTPLAAEIADALMQAGISTITGEIQIEQNLKQAGCNPTWEIEDVAWDYGAGLYGFNFSDNTFYLWPATKETKPYVPGLSVTALQDLDGTELLRGIDSNNLTVYGKDPENPKWRITTTMDNPAQVFRGVLLEQLRSKGIEVLEQPISDVSTRMLVCKHQSEALIDILRQMMVESHNLYAEGVQRALLPQGSRAEAIDSEKKVLNAIGIPTANNKINDGSGLSRTDRLQPVFISQVLEKMARSSMADSYVALFPKAGEEGTVKSLLKKTSLAGQLALKSGSMGGVQCYAGYKLDADGKPTHTVVIIVNSFFCPRGQVRGAIETFLQSIFK